MPVSPWLDEAVVAVGGGAVGCGGLVATTELVGWISGGVVAEGAGGCVGCSVGVGVVVGKGVSVGAVVAVGNMTDRVEANGGVGVERLVAPTGEKATK